MENQRGDRLLRFMVSVGMWWDGFDTSLASLRSASRCAEQKVVFESRQQDASGNTTYLVTSYFVTLCGGSQQCHANPTLQSASIVRRRGM